MNHYSKTGGYSGYDKNHKERDALDYYSTPTKEVTNILNILNINFDNCTILEPCCGGGHMVKGIIDYLPINFNTNIIATDVQKRPSILKDTDWYSGLEYDFLSDEYPYTENIDYIIMNPPFSTIEPFAMKALEIARKGVIMFGRLQFLEGEKRYNNILSKNPPTKTYVYVNRIACYKNGDLSQKLSSAQAYAWFYWDLIPTNYTVTPELHWIKRIENEKKK